jgi:beta-galactosidase
LSHISTAWYRNTFILPKDSNGKKYYFFSYERASVYLNGKKVGEEWLVILF